VGTFHAALDDSILYRYLHVWARKIIDALAVKIAVSEAAKEYVAARFGGTYRIIPNGVPVDLYEMAREGERIPGRILFIGRAEPRKGLLVLLRAFAQLRLQRPDATLVLVGPRWSQVHGLVERSDSGLTWPIPGIAALGRVSHEVKVEEMGSAEILCVPSLQGESFGIVLAEGLAAGLPVVASDLPGYRSVLKDGRVGVLVPPRDHVALATTLLETLADTDGRATLTANGIEAAEELAWERVAARVMETYQEAVEIGVGAVS